jgi:hypothetical protein
MMPEERSRSEDRAEPEPRAAPVCPVALCPVAFVLTAAGQARPEVFQHLLAAGNELLLALKTLIEVRLEARERDEPLERITIE